MTSASSASTWTAKTTPRPTAPRPAPAPRAAAPEPAAPRRNPGFVLYVGVDAAPGEQPQAQLVELAEALGELARDWLPSARDVHGARARRAHDRDDVARPGHRRVPRAARDPLARAARRHRPRGAHGHRGGPLARLTFRELELLSYLARTAHRVVTRAELLETVWADHEVASGSRTIDVHVRRLREKLGLEHVITTVRGLGYRFDPQTPVVLGGSGDAA
ncbi:hypothetical protein IU11_03725 [Cellulosimicrobium sp. MM]|nr:winged helix-turn-helix domain-containing protein [Cellulosimicrobium sp. MM]KFD44290.1 hypothetical protein IU11_03725 [Cellulosimicrobium sp. MM]